MPPETSVSPACHKLMAAALYTDINGNSILPSLIKKEEREGASRPRGEKGVRKSRRNKVK